MTSRSGIGSGGSEKREGRSVEIRDIKEWIPSSRNQVKDHRTGRRFVKDNFHQVHKNVEIAVPLILLLTM